jgi:HK97 gp10 family phage protein
MALKFVLNTAPLYRLGEMLDRKLDEAAEKLAEETVERARDLVPVRTGALQRSIDKEQAGEQHWEVFAGMDYAAAVEYGSQGRAARPYLTPAMEEAKEKMPAVIAEALNAAAKEAGGRG